MGKEVKIGLSVIVVLVLCLGGVIAKRVMSNAKPQQASTSDEPAPAKDKDGKTSNAKAAAQPLQSATPGAKPTVVAAKPATGRSAQSSPLDVGQWNAAGDNAKRAAGDAAAKGTASSYMPKSPQPYELDPNDRYAANYTPPRNARAGTAEVGSADTGMAGASDGASEPYDPFRGYDNRRVAAAGQNAPASGLKVIPPAGAPATAKSGMTAPGAATPSYASRDGAARGTSAGKATADHAGQSDPFAGRYAAQPDYGAAESRYAASRGAAGYAEPGQTAAQGTARNSTSYTPGASGYAAARPSPSYGNPNRNDPRAESGYGAGYGSGYGASQSPGYGASNSPGYGSSHSPGYGSSTGYGPSYGMQRDPRRDDGTYEVQPNDNYWTISQKCYGTGAYFKALAEVNRKKVPQEDQLKVGAIVSAPDVAQLERQYPKLCPKPSRREVVKRGATQVSTSAHLAGARTYVSQEGDTLYEVAKSELGKASRWVEIYELNREQIGPDYDYLPAGLHLALPGNEPTDSVTRRPSTGPAMRYQR